MDERASGDSGGPFSSFRRMLTLDYILRFPTQKYIVIKDRPLVCPALSLTGVRACDGHA